MANDPSEIPVSGSGGSKKAYAVPQQPTLPNAQSVPSNPVQAPPTGFHALVKGRTGILPDDPTNQ